MAKKTTRAAAVRTVKAAKASRASKAPKRAKAAKTAKAPEAAKAPSAAPPSSRPPSEAERLAEAWQAFAERGRRVMEAATERQRQDGGFQVPDPAVIAKAFLTLGERLLADPERLARAQARLADDLGRLGEVVSARLAGKEAAPAAEPAPDDKRFKDDDWRELPWFDAIKQAYLVGTRWLADTVRDVDGLDPATRRKVDFYTRQWIDALSPTNFVATNPRVLRETVESKGRNLARGLDHLMNDMERGKGRLKISMTDTTAFQAGRNIAVTPGKIVYENDLMQLIQYAPATASVARRPLLIVPPWINKYYVLDLQPRNSFVKWAVDQGHTVFVISWVNPDGALSSKGFDDYLREGPLAALDAIERATGEKQVNIVGYCIGGTLTACTLAWLAAKKQKRIASATFLTTMVDFADAGELSIFIDEEQLAGLEAHMEKKGFLEGEHMSAVFSLMRANDLVWSFVIHNYLLGREPMPFDLLYWNADSTRMPAMMHRFYLREMYLENRLSRPGGISLAGVPIDLSKIDVPVYVLATREDHIAPWKSAYRATQFYGGPVRFVLAASGHIAGVINPPAANKYGHWTSEGDCSPDADAWLASAKSREGSWWPDWQTWIAGFAGGTAKARMPGEGKLQAIEDAPGRYVQVRCD